MYWNRFTLSTLLALGCACAQAADPPDAPAAPAVTLRQVMAAAATNADANIARLGVDAGRADVRAADHAPMPVLSAKAASIDLQNGVGAGNPLIRKRIDKSVGVDWTWERGNKRALRTRAAEDALQALQADAEQVRLAQQQQAQDAFWELLAAQERLTEITAIGDDARSLAGIAERRLRAGDLSEQDALRIRVESDRALADVRSARLDVQRAALALHQLTRLGDESAAGATLRAEGDWPTADALLAVDAGGASWSLLADRQPEVRAARSRATAAQAALDGALALKKTDVTWGASFDHYPGTSNRLLELRLSIPLQVGYAHEGEIGRAQAELAQAQESLTQAQLRAQGNVQRMALELGAVAARARDYDGLVLPRARQAEDRAQLAYERGALPLSDLLDARRTLRAVVLEALSTRADHAKAAGAWLLLHSPQAP